MNTKKIMMDYLTPDPDEPAESDNLRLLIKAYIEELEADLSVEKGNAKYLRKCCVEAGEELAKYSFSWDGKEKNLKLQAMNLNEKHEELELENMQLFKKARDAEIDVSLQYEIAMKYKSTINEQAKEIEELERIIKNWDDEKIETREDAHQSFKDFMDEAKAKIKDKDQKIAELEKELQSTIDRYRKALKHYSLRGMGSCRSNEVGYCDSYIAKTANKSFIFSKVFFIPEK